MARHQSSIAFLPSEDSRLTKHEPQVHRVEPTNIRKGDSVHQESCSHSQYLLFQTGAGFAIMHGNMGSSLLKILLSLPPFLLPTTCPTFPPKAAFLHRSLLTLLPIAEVGEHLAHAWLQQQPSPKKKVFSTQELHPSPPENSRWLPPWSIKSHVPPLKAVTFPTLSYVRIHSFPQHPSCNQGKQCNIPRTCTTAFTKL